MRILRRLFRMSRLLLHLAKGFWWGWRRLPAGKPPQGEADWATIRQWQHEALAILGVHVRVHGERIDGPALFVANHISWIDIGVMLTVIDAGFLGKAELRDWPLLGFLVVRGGTIFIQRGARDAAASASEEIARRLASGASAAVFPEGTTSIGGPHMRRFHPRIFEGARRVGAPVQPVALVYDSALVPFVDDEAFWPNVWRVLGADRIEVDLYLLPPVETEGRDRRSIARDAEDEVARIVRALPDPAAG